MWRLLRAIGYLFTGRFRRAYEAMMTNPNVMEGTYNAAIAKREMSVEEVKNAVAKIMRVKVEKETKLKELLKAQEKLTLVKTGAGNKAKARSAELQGQGVAADEIKKDAEILRCMAAFNDASSSLKDKEETINILEGEIKEYQKQINDYTGKLQTMQRNVEKLKDEKHEALAGMALAKQEAVINSALAGINTTQSDEDLKAARDALQEMKARAKISSHLAGTDARQADDEFEKYATSTAAASEFDALLNLDAKENGGKSLDPAKLPE